MSTESVVVTSDESAFSTPMMMQYLELKKNYTDCLLLFRLGDFYELFLEDAVIGSKVLNITLTSRSRGRDGRIPMAGVPYHALDGYLAKLIQAGYRVAICDQLTPPGKGLVERQVTRVITPGTFLQDMPFDTQQHYLLSIAKHKTVLGWCVSDFATGEQWYGEFPSQQSEHEFYLSNLITTFEVTECLLSSAEKNSALELQLKKHPLVRLTFPTDWKNWTRISSNFFSELPQPIRQAISVNQNYISSTQHTTNLHLTLPKAWVSDEWFTLPRSTIVNLEILQTMHEGIHTGSLLHTIDQTTTSMGSRLLKKWLLAPLKKETAIQNRQQIVSQLIDSVALREKLRELLGQLPDFERLIARLTVGLGTARDVARLRDGLLIVTQLIQLADLPKIAWTYPELSWTRELLQLLQTALVPEPALEPRQGNVIATEYNQQLDALRSIKQTQEAWMAEYEKITRQSTGISSLKVRYNQVFGYYLEVSKANRDFVPSHFVRTQTLVNAERYSTPELITHQQELLAATEKAVVIEIELLAHLKMAVLAQTSQWQKLAQSLAQLDCLVSFATTATEHHYVRPTLTQSGALHITHGRHPVVEQLLSTNRFIPNSVTLSNTTPQIMIVTGPNMAGKSVYMRQIAVIVLLAHIGSFVPAEAAEISLVDQIFVRSGASDKMHTGQSTFMVEMAETATILSQASEKSFIIMDEIGRGTSTFDGISIAWAVVEHLVRNPTGPKTLFATHYHELQALSEQFPNRVVNAHLEIAAHDSKPVFLYQLKAGGASHSFGVAVAELAGLPSTVTDRAKILLEELENHSHTAHTKTDTTPAVLEEQVTLTTRDTVLSQLKTLALEEVTPLKALNLLAEWKSKL